jgi:hypothetical protein
MPANRATTFARTCALCAHTLPADQDQFCDGLCAASWRQLHQTGANAQGAVMPADVARTLKQVLCGDSVERSSAIRLYAWLRQPSQPASR